MLSRADAHRLGGSEGGHSGPVSGVPTGGARTAWGAAGAEPAAPGPGGTSAGRRRTSPGAGRLLAAALGPARRESRRCRARRRSTTRGSRR